jgi:hypothetical protein
VELKEVFAEDFHKDIFFVLVCGPFLLIENFSRSSETRPAMRSLLRWKMSAFSDCNHLIQGAGLGQQRH